MAGSRGGARILAIALLSAALLVAALLSWGLPAVAPALASLNAGLDLKLATLWGFGVTVALFAVLALVAGDGLLGELQFMLGAFFGFFIVLTLLIALIF